MLHIATLWADLLLHLHTNMMSRYHIFSWRYHDHDNDEDEDE
jgi:nicotinamide riboside transporter PnuC